MSKNEKGAIIKQASILAVAGLVVRLIGILYRSPMNGIIGSLGSGYYSYAYNVYTILLLVSSYSIPMAVSKVMAERIALGEYRNANKVFKGALLYAIVVGGAAGLVIFFGAQVLLPKGQENAIFALQMLAPTIFISGILGVFRGYFQAHNTMVPTSISQIAEQAMNAVISVGAAWIMTRSVVGNEVQVAIRGAAGGTIGTGAGVLFGLIFILFIYRKKRKEEQHYIAHDTHKTEESYKKVFKVLILMVTPVILSTCIYNINSYLDQNIFSDLMLSKGMDAEEIAAQFGVYSLQYMTMINIPLALASATSSTVVPAVAASYALGRRKEARGKMDEGIRLTMFIAIPSAVGMAVLSEPLMKLLFPSGDIKAGGLYLTIGAISIVFYCLSTITNGVLQGIGRPGIPVRNATFSLFINVVMLVLMVLLFPQLGVVNVVITTTVYALNMTILNSMALRKHLHYKNKFMKIYAKPLLSSVAMGIVVKIIYWILAFILPSSYIGNAINVAISVLIGVIVYIILFILLSRPTEKEIRALPGGGYLIKAVRKLKQR